MTLRVAVDMGSPGAFACAPRTKQGALLIGGYADGYADGFGDGSLNGFTGGIAWGRGRGADVAIPQAYAAGREDGFLSGNRAGALGASGDTNPPTITIVSPTPGVAPGLPGGFPSDPAAAKTTPIVLTVGDVDPGLQYVTLVVSYSTEDAEGNAITVEETIYRGGNFRGRFVEGSTAVVVGTDLQFSIVRHDGWLELGRYFTFDADAIDKAGNMTNV